MSETDSFIKEVTEEVRRDRLFALMRRYGGAAVAVVVLIVGGATYNEWRKAQNTAAAQAFGDSVLMALDHEEADARVAALSDIAADGSGRMLLSLLEASETEPTEDRAATAAATALGRIAEDSELPRLYRDLAALKRVIVLGPDLSAGERRTILGAIAAPGAPFRLLAEEQLALLEIEAGETEAAINRLRSIISDVEVTPGLRNRASQLIVALGGEPEAA